MPIRKIGGIADDIMFAVWAKNRGEALKLLMELIKIVKGVVKELK